MIQNGNVCNVKHFVRKPELNTIKLQMHLFEHRPRNPSI